MSGERTEAATPKRREEARQKGNVPRSVELSSVIGLLAGVFVLRSAGGGVLQQVVELMGASFSGLTVADWTVASVSTYGSALGMLYLGMMAPIFVTVLAVGVAGNVLQTGFVVTGKPLSPDFSRIDPSKGIKRMISQRALVEFFKSVTKLAIVGFIAYQAFQSRYLMIVSLTGADIQGAMGLIVDVAMEILLKSGFALLALAALDYAYQRWEHGRNLRMSKQEVKEEFRQSEGDPKIKSKIRQQQRQMASRRMMQDVPNSDVVITNPTHFAVALQYKPESMRSPKVVAKGQLLVAQRIKDLAREHGVPVIENKPLAQALFKTVEVGSEIPPSLYHAVAEILAFIFSLKRARRVGGRSIGG